MSRIGKKPVDLPAGVTAKIDGQKVSIKGPKGELHLSVHPNIAVKIEDGKQLLVSRHDDEAENRALHGLTRALLSNMVNGVVNPFTKKPETQGVGYQAQSRRTSPSQAVIARRSGSLLRSFAGCVPPSPTRGRGSATRERMCGARRASLRPVASVVDRRRT